MKKNPYPHECHSTTSGKVKYASKFWVFEKVKDQVFENPKVAAMELKRRIKDEFTVVVLVYRSLLTTNYLEIGSPNLTICIGSSCKLRNLV